jgi:hypothetical protein
MGWRWHAPSLLQFGQWWRSPVVLRSRGGAKWSHRTLVKVLMQAENLGERWLGVAAMGFRALFLRWGKATGGHLGAPIYRPRSPARVKQRPK